MVDQIQLKRLTREIESAEDFAQAEAALCRIARLIDLPVVAWCPDVCIPHYNAHMDAFMLRNGWPPETMNLWWTHAVMMKHPIYLNCRINSLPFIMNMADETKSMFSDVRKINADVIRRGVSSSITVPIRLPRAQVAMLFFGGPKKIDETQKILEDTRTELIATGLYFMRTFLHETGNVTQNEELLSRLTPKQWECLRLSAQGYRETEIAKIMEIATPTVRYHLKNATKNMGASTRAHAIAIAAQLGMLGPISI